MQPKENTVIEFLSGKTAKIIGGALLVGAAWGRFEYKMDAKFNDLIKKLDEHILADKFEKDAMQKEITELRGTVNRMQDQAENFIRSEYIRPEEIRPKEERRRR